MIRNTFTQLPPLNDSEFQTNPFVRRLHVFVLYTTGFHPWLINFCPVRAVETLSIFLSDVTQNFQLTARLNTPLLKQYSLSSRASRASREIFLSHSTLKEEYIINDRIHSQLNFKRLPALRSKRGVSLPSEMCFFIRREVMSSITHLWVPYTRPVIYGRFNWRSHIPHDSPPIHWRV